jgi:phosphoribosylanthranilate isomerase
MVRIKICGITNEEDAAAAVEAGADALGFIFYEPSPRYVPPERVRPITGALPPFVTTVGVFVNVPCSQLNEIAQICGLHAVQLHGDESPDYCRMVERTVIKAFRVKDASWREEARRYKVHAMLLDTHAPDRYGGTGQTFDWALVAASPHPVILSGGLNADNVQEAVRRVRPYGVDVGSGVERAPGRKDHAKIRAFVEKVKEIHGA